MIQESGRSLIEIIGILAIVGLMTAGTLAAYNTISSRQTRTIALSELELLAKNTKLLMENRNDYTDVSVDYLIKSGALKNDKSPIGSADWSVSSSLDGYSFSINLTGLSKGDCNYFTTINLPWAYSLKVNGNETEPGLYCLSTGGNQVSILVD